MLIMSLEHPGSCSFIRSFVKLPGGGAYSVRLVESPHLHEVRIMALLSFRQITQGGYNISTSFRALFLV